MAAAARQRPLLDSFTAWLTAFGDAWEAADRERMADLFALGATVQPEPFAGLLRGRPAIVDYFGAVLAEWPRASFAAQVLGVGDTYGIAHWRVGVADRAIDGVLVCALDAGGRCTSLRQWWHASERAPGN